MKNQLLIFVLALLTLTACKEAENNQEDATKEVEVEEVVDNTETFNDRVAILKAYLQAHCDEDIEAQKAILSDTLKWSPPNHTEGEWLGKDDLVGALQGYHADYENITYTAGIVLPNNTGPGFFSGNQYSSDGTVNSGANAFRSYGTWQATHVATGKSIKVKWFGVSSFNEDNKIVMTTEYWDLGGLIAQVQSE